MRIGVLPSRCVFEEFLVIELFENIAVNVDIEKKKEEAKDK